MEATLIEKWGKSLGSQAELTEDEEAKDEQLSLRSSYSVNLNYSNSNSRSWLRTGTVHSLSVVHCCFSSLTLMQHKPEGRCT